MKLVIVESPTKARTIQRFLDKSYILKSSYGHVRDLPKRSLGVDIENDFQPKYVIPPKARGIIKGLKESLKKADKVILATDEDREGEAIAWHLTQVLGLEESQAVNSKPYQRIVFHEITKKAIEEALKNPRNIDLNLVNSQQARRILDRLVGYKLSPFLWKKLIRGLSAGRVQSVAVRLIVEREKEREQFVPQEYWTIEALFEKEKIKFSALLNKKDNKTLPKLGIRTKKEAEDILRELKNQSYQVVKVETKEVKRNPLPPFTTSTLQQEAWQKFKFPAKKTMFLAQNLYEQGFITYHRTDSLNLSNFALFQAKKFIASQFGEEYWAGYFRKYKTKAKTAQEAHEAIRPTFVENTPEKLKSKLEKDQQKLYELIWKRFLATQMKEALLEETTVEIQAKNYIFSTRGQTIKFEGFLKIYPLQISENLLPPLKEGETLKLLQLVPKQHFTKPPARFTEATLIKTLEKYGIGRPSTYASILSTIQERNYVKKDRFKSFYPTELGILVNEILTTHFPEIVDINFTAKMEEDLDEIALGKKNWQAVIRSFYFPFAKKLEDKYREVKKQGILEEKTNKICPKCGSSLVLRLGKYGRFYACSSFPKCKYTESWQAQTKMINPKQNGSRSHPKTQRKNR